MDQQRLDAIRARCNAATPGPWELTKDGRYELGSRKYAERNWEQGIPFGRLIQSGLRHMYRWMQGRRDEDHLAAVCWNVMAMMHFEETGQAEEWNNYPAYQRERLGGTRTIELYGDDRIIDRVVERTYARHPASSTKRDAAASATPNPHHRPYKIIAVDFDGCLCKNAWPGIGEPNTPLIEELKQRRDNGDKLILWTCREGERLAEALQWCEDRGLRFDAANENLPEMNAMYGNDSRKIGADLYIDDKAKNVKA